MPRTLSEREKHLPKYRFMIDKEVRRGYDERNRGKIKVNLTIGTIKPIVTSQLQQKNGKT